MSKMRKKEHDLQSKIEEERNQPKSKIFIFFINKIEEFWKLKRFQSVDPKVPNHVVKSEKRLIFHIGDK